MPQKKEKIKLGNRKKKFVLFFIIFFCLIFLKANWVFALEAGQIVLGAGGSAAGCNSAVTSASGGTLIGVIDLGVCRATEKIKAQDKGKWDWEEAMRKLWAAVQEAGSKALKKAIHEALLTLAVETADYVGSGGKGQKPLFIKEGWGEYLKNIADNAGGNYIENLDKQYGVNLCHPSLGVKTKIGLGLVAVEKPKALDCIFSQMVNNWDQELQRKDFLSRFQNMFEPTSSDLGIALMAQSGITQNKQEYIDIGKLFRLGNRGWLTVENIAGQTEGIPLEGEARVKQLQDLYTKSWGNYTGDALVDAANVFLNKLAITALNNLLANLGKDKPTYTSPYAGNYGGYEAGPTTGGAAGVKEKTRKLAEIQFNVRGDYNILAELTQCPDPNKAGPTNCVITDKFSQAISEKLTVGEAVEQGYLNAGGIFGFTADGLEPAYNEGYPYRSMIILRKFRIVPVGWEVAAQYIKTNPSGIDGTKNLGDLAACFDSNDEYTGYNDDGSKIWCEGLVDPNWVLKAPLNYCKREGPGPEILSEQVTGSGESSELTISRKDNYCADEQSCIKENNDGSCVAYGYCAEERRKWQFDGKSCDPTYNTCQTFRASDGKTVSYLENSLDYRFCSVETTGCQWYCQDYDYSLGDWTCGLTGGNKLYLDKDAEECDVGSEGCHEFIRTKPGIGANLLPNSSFEKIGPSDAVDDNNPDTFDWWGIIGEAVSGGSDGSAALKLNATFIRNITVGPVDYNMAGQTYTLSFYAKDCGTQNFGIESNLISMNTTSDWQYFKQTYIYPQIAAGNQAEITIQVAMSCLIDAIKLERGDGASYDDYRESGLVYEKLLPEYLENACYINPGMDFGLKDNAPAECDNFARKCNESEAGCELYTSNTSGISIPGQVTAQDYCPAECVGYDTYIQKDTVFDSLRDAYFIPSTAQTCAAAASGCDEFTNLDEVKKGGEGKEYYTYLKQCIKPSVADCAEFYTWEGSDETGYQLRVFQMKKDPVISGAPYVPDTTESYKEKYCQIASDYDPGNNPMCRQFYNTSGEVFYRFYPYTITCSDNCQPYRRTENNIEPSITDQISCGALCNNALADGETYCWDNSANACYYCKSGGQWDSGHFACLYDAIPGEGETCSASEASCREYAGNTGNNTRIILNNNFEGSAQGWTGIGGALASVKSKSLMVGGNSLYVSGAPFSISATVGQLVGRGNSYVLSFIAQSESAPVNLSAQLDSGTAIALFQGDASLISGEWRIYQLNLTELAHAVTNGEALIIAGDGNFYIDDVKLTEIRDRHFLIKNSWNTPASCFQDIYGSPVGALYNLGCDSYNDRDGNTHYLHSFDSLCQESAVGCELMIDTYNSSDYQSAIWNDSNSNGVCDLSEPDCVNVPADSFTYIVYDKEKLCGSDSKGCQRLGDYYQYAGDYLFNDTYLENNPDKYNEILCGEGAVACEEWTSGEGASYFKDPGAQVCEWRQISGQQGGWGWYKKKILRCDTDGDGAGDGGLCLSDSDCGASQLCKSEATDTACPASYFKTFGYGGNGNRVEQPTYDNDGFWAGLCPASAAGCSEYIDPISKFSTNEVFNSDFSQDVDLNLLPDGWSAVANGVQNINLDPYTLYILTVSGVNQAEVIVKGPGPSLYELDNNNLLGPPVFQISVNSTNPKGRVSKIFYAFAGFTEPKVSALNSSLKNGSKIEVREAAIDYQLKQELDKTSCNGIVDFSQGCVLFNERAQNGFEVAKLIYDADKNEIDPALKTPYTPSPSDGSEDANSLIKVSPDRVCDQWLACRSKVAVKKESGEEENVCYDIGLCDKVDENGNCANFIPEKKIDRNVNLPGDFSKFTNVSGYSKVGLANVTDNTMRGDYPFGAMEQEGELAYLPNGNFEIAGDNGYPIGWVWEGGTWDKGKFRIIDNPYTAQVEGIGYAPEGRNFLKLGTVASSTSEFADVIGNADYIITVYVNTMNLATGTAKLNIKQFKSDGAFIREDNLISYSGGNDWGLELGRFKTDPNASRIKIVLYADSSTVGNFYFDDIKIRPALNSRTAWYTPQSCRLYPEDSSLSCDYYDDSGLRRKGWSGYCLEYDRAPGSSDACVLWWPVDKVKGEGIEEGAGYNDKIPLYYCLEAVPYCDGGQAKYYCSKLVQTVTSAGQNKFWAGRVYQGSNYEIPFASSMSGANIEWGGGLTENVIINYIRDDQPFGSIVPPGSENNPYEWDAVVDTPSDINTQPLPVTRPGTDLNGNPPRAGTPYYGGKITCGTSGTNTQGNCSDSCGCSNGSFGACSSSGCSIWDLGIWDNCWVTSSDLDDGFGLYSNPANNNWYMFIDDGCDNYPADYASYQCTSNLGFNIAANLDEAKRGVQGIFAQSYGGWEWIGNESNGRYMATSTLDWGPSTTLCPGGVRPAWPNDYCAILPRVFNIAVNKATSTDVALIKNQFVNFTFNTDVDSQQMPMVMYAIDWGDNEKTVVSGVEMRARPNADNPHSLYHLYSYWDLKGKAASGTYGVDHWIDCTTTAGECRVQPKVQIKDNWGWCNGGSAINDCAQWDAFGAWVVVKEK